ncbi:MAG TPA: M48 family metallopeptidase [Candidatus Angelobacter sp.]|nr:M48 family metallopeptidase [Candidatus Angelobacter sp.]
MQRRTFSTRALALGLTLLLAQPLALMGQSAQPQLPDPGTPSMNKQQQEQLGLQAIGEVYKQMPVLPDSSRETQYVQQLAKKLQAVIPADKNWPYQFHVIQASDINAFALPGGPIFVNVGTITAAENEAQLAGVLAHEMSHVYMQHSAKQAPKATVAQIIAGLAGAVLPQSGIGNLGRMGIQIGAGTMLMKYSRKDEAQADATGAIIMYRAGYNPQAMADFFETLEKKYGSGGPQLLSDHPNPGNRTAAVQKEIQNWPRKNYVNDSPQFASAKQDAAHVKAYSAQEIANGAKSGAWAEQNKKNGMVPTKVPVSSNENNTNTPASANGGNGAAAATDISFKQVKPSGNFTQLQQGTFSISYPDNWKTAGDQNTVMIAPQQGAGENGISYGVMIGAAQGGSTLDQSTQQVIQNMQQDNPGMQVSGDPQNVEINGVQGRSVFLQGKSPLQQDGKPLPERDWLVTLPRPDGRMMYLVFVSPERDFNQLHPTYQKMLDSLQVH